jgi:hypothetical protein
MRENRTYTAESRGGDKRNYKQAQRQDDQKKPAESSQEQLKNIEADLLSCGHPNWRCPVHLATPYHKPRVRMNRARMKNWMQTDMTIPHRKPHNQPTNHTATQPPHCTASDMQPHRKNTAQQTRHAHHTHRTRTHHIHTHSHTYTHTPHLVRDAQQNPATDIMLLERAAHCFAKALYDKRGSVNGHVNRYNIVQHITKCTVQYAKHIKHSTVHNTQIQSSQCMKQYRVHSTQYKVYTT